MIQIGRSLKIGQSSKCAVGTNVPTISIIITNIMGFVNIWDYSPPFQIQKILYKRGKNKKRGGFETKVEPHPSEALDMTSAMSLIHCFRPHFGD